MRYEQLMTIISDSGPAYRWIITFLIAAISMKSGLNVFILALSTASQPFHCAEAVVDGNVVAWSDIDASYGPVLNRSDFTCNRPSFYRDASGQLQLERSSNASLSKCESWNFQPTWAARRTLLMDHNMVCDRAYLANRLQTIMQFGKLMSTFTGPIGDMWGRKTMLVVFAFLDLACNAAMIFVSSLEAKMVLLLGMGAVGQGVVAGVILVTETVAEKYRGINGNLLWLMWVVGYMVPAGLCYYVADWRWQMAISVILAFAFFATYIPLLPESPRWLLISGRRVRAEKIIREMSHFSGCSQVVDEFDFNNNEVVNSELQNQKPSLIPRDRILDASFLVTSAVVVLTFFACAIVYYALSLQRDFISSDPYLNVLISSVLELPAYLLGWQLCDRAGRLSSSVVTLLLCGTSLLALPYIPLDLSIPLRPAVAIFAKFCITTAFSVFALYSSELLPTTMRSTSLYVSCLVMRAAQMAAAEVGTWLAEVYPPLPSLLYGGITCLFAASLLILPETKGQPMPNRVDDMPPLRCGLSGQRVSKEKNFEIAPEFEPLKA